jgi:hypothetical protein
MVKFLLVAMTALLVAFVSCEAAARKIDFLLQSREKFELKICCFCSRGMEKHVAGFISSIKVESEN